MESRLSYPNVPERIRTAGLPLRREDVPMACNSLSHLFMPFYVKMYLPELEYSRCFSAFYTILVQDKLYPAIRRKLEKRHFNPFFKVQIRKILEDSMP